MYVSHESSSAGFVFVCVCVCVRVFSELANAIRTYVRTSRPAGVELVNKYIVLSTLVLRYFAICAFAYTTYPARLLISR